MTIDTVQAAPDATDPGRGVWGSFVGGQWLAPEGSDLFDVFEPSTGHRLAQVVVADADLVDHAVTDARRAYDDVWRHLTPRERGALLRQVAARIRDNAEELGELEAREVGKPMRDALRFDVSFSSAGFDYYAGLADTLHGDLIDQGPIEARVTYEPYGVVAAILPFNWPPIHFTKKLAPALAAGNTAVIKPGEQAPLSVLRLVEIANEVLPPGVINAVTGPLSGPALSAHPTVERITFTGATATGRAVLKSAAENLTYATMELGGKNALIVLDDADMDVAVDVAIEGMFYNQGEACTSTARILVHRSRYDEFTEKFSAAAESLVVGDALDGATDIGAMVDLAHQQKVLAYLQTALDEGAEIVAQGTSPHRPEARRRLLGPAHRADRRRAAHDGGAGGDLRSHRVPHGVRHRRRGDRDRQRHRVRAHRGAHHPRPLPGLTSLRAARGRHGVHQQLHATGVPRITLRRGQGQRVRARELARHPPRVRPGQEHPVPLGARRDPDVAAAGLKEAA